MAAMSEYVSSVHIFACLFFSRLNEPFSPPSQIESGDEGGENSERNEFFLLQCENNISHRKLCDCNYTDRYRLFHYEFRFV